MGNKMYRKVRRTGGRGGGKRRTLAVCCISSITEGRTRRIKGVTKCDVAVGELNSSPSAALTALATDATNYLGHKTATLRTSRVQFGLMRPLQIHLSNSYLKTHKG